MRAGFDRIGPAARLVLGPDTGAVVSPSARLIYAAVFRPLAKDDDLETSLGPPTDRALMQATKTALMNGATASFEIALPEGTPVTPAFTRRAVRVQLYRSGAADAYDIAIVSEDLTSAAPTTMPTAAGREMVVIQRKLIDGGDRIALAIPMAFPQSTVKTIVIDLVLADAVPDGDPALTQAKTEIDAASAAIELTKSTAAPSTDDLVMGQSLSSLTAPGVSPRAALAFLAERTGARLTQSVALVADDRLLQVIAGDVQKRLAQMPSRDRRSVAWLLDRATIDSLATVKEEDAASILPPIQGALSIYAGEAGRQLDTLRSLAGEATSSDDLYNRIIAEHLILLEESSPGLRVRAYDWLRAAGHAPAGYDPLASPQERRAALERAREPATQSTTQPMPAQGATP